MAGRPPKPPDLTLYSGRVAARLRQLREAAGLSVDELAVKISAAGYPCTAVNLYRFESGIRQVPLDGLPAIAKALRKTVGELMPPK